jgi:hypothetical protein
MMTWIEGTLEKLVCTLKTNDIPEQNESCEYCKYQKKFSKVLDQ